MKKILKSVLAFVLIVPFAFLLVACGGTKSLEGKKYVYSKVEVSGTLSQEEIESLYSSIETYEFYETTLVYTYGTGDDDNFTFDYKYENGKVYIKEQNEDEYPKTYFEISGKYLIATETIEDGQTFKVYYKQK